MERKDSGSSDAEHGVMTSTYIRPQARKLHDPAVSFEEYHYYALQTRAEEEGAPAPKTDWREILLRKKPALHAGPGGNAMEKQHHHDAAATDVNFSNQNRRMEISDQEWENASRAFRTATWGACFYLITTDILGPYGVGFAMGTLGWGPGIVLYTVFGFLAGYSGVG